jgi:hypothetical protein
MVMRISAISLVACLISLSAHSQKLPKFGEVTAEELKMTTCPIDSSASAVILFDKGEISLDGDLRATFKRHIRIKILTKGGLDWGNYSLRLRRANQGISKLKGSTYNLEGGTVVVSAMEDKSVFRGKFDKFRDQVKFTLPNVKEGSVIEYSYVLNSTASLLPDWQFQYSIPNLWSEYAVNIPTMFTFRKDVRGFVPLTRHESKNEGDHELFVMTDVPAFKEEPFLTNPDDFISKISFYISEVIIPGTPVYSLIKSWETIVKEYYKEDSFGVQINGSGFLKKTVEELTAGMTDPEKKIEAIYKYVKSSVAWNSLTDRIPDRTFKKVLEDKKGSSSEINLLMVCMLRKAGVLADPMFLSTRDNGLVREFLTQVDQFNDVICVVTVGGKKRLMDATDKDLPITALPERCMNGKGMIVGENGPEWIPIISARSRKIISADLKIDPAGELTGTLIITGDGIQGGDMRRSYRELGEEKYMKAMLEGKSWEVGKSEFKNMQDPSVPAAENHQLIIREHAQASGSAIYVNPFVIDRMEENQFKSERREYPVDFTCPFEKLHTIKIAVPDGFITEDLPKPKLIGLPGGGGKYTYSVMQVGNTISVTSQLIINKSVFVPDEYPVLREFYNQVLAKQAEQLVLKKK